MEPTSPKKSIPQFAYIIGGILLALTAFFILQQTRSNISSTTTQETIQVATTAANPKLSTVTYKGVEGKTALELLQAAEQIEITGEAEDAFVTAIGGTQAEFMKTYWAFYINGQYATVGAGRYITKDTDTIEWKIEEIKP